MGKKLILIYGFEVINSLYRCLPSTAYPISPQETLWSEKGPWVRVSITASPREAQVFFSLSIIFSQYGTYASCSLVVAPEVLPPDSSTVVPREDEPGKEETETFHQPGAFDCPAPVMLLITRA